MARYYRNEDGTIYDRKTGETIVPRRELCFDDGYEVLTWSGKWLFIEKDEIEEVIKEGKVRTYDMGGDASTLDMARAIAKKYEEV